MVTLKQSIGYVSKHKHLFGFSGWSFKLYDCREKKCNTIASAQIDYYNKLIEIQLYADYWREDWKETLIHELVHARLGVASEKYEELTKKIRYELEEDAVNDITRGVMELLE